MLLNNGFLYLRRSRDQDLQEEQAPIRPTEHTTCLSIHTQILVCGAFVMRDVCHNNSLPHLGHIAAVQLPKMVFKVKVP